MRNIETKKNFVQLEFHHDQFPIQIEK